MKVLFFYQYFGTSKGSWSTRVYELTRRWVDSGHQVTVVTAPYEKSDINAQGFISHQMVEGINIIVINSGDSNRSSVIRRAFNALQFAIISIYYTLALSYDIVIASSGPITIGIPMIFAKKIKRSKTVFEVRDLWPAGGIEMGLLKKKWQQSIALWFEKICYNSADLIVTASSGQRENIVSRFPDRNFLTIPNASDIDLFGVKDKGVLPDWTENKIIFTHIGSLGLIHNIQYWMSVAVALKKIDLRGRIILVFIGDGVDRTNLEKTKAELHLDNILFLGLKPKTDLPAWVQKSCCTLFATLDNPVQDTCCPNKIFDSFAAGIPVVQTSSGWIRDLIDENQCGVNVSLKTPDITAQILLDLTQQKDKIEQMGQNARKLAIEQFNMDTLAQSYSEAMRDLHNK